MTSIKIKFVILLMFILISCNTNNLIENEKKLYLISPNGGEEYSIGNTILINWHSENIRNVKIKYLSKEPKSDIILIDSLWAGANKLSWKIPGIKSKTASILVMDAGDESIFDESAVFRIELNKEAFKYYPLHIGNEWRYVEKKWNYWTDSTTIEKEYIVKIISDTIFNKKKYYIFQERIIFPKIVNRLSFHRLDSLSNRLYIKASKRFDFGRTSGYDEDIYYSTSIIEFFSIEELGLVHEAKTYEYSNNSSIRRYYFVKGIGEVHKFYDDTVGRVYNTYLYYAKINGKEYGKK